MQVVCLRELYTKQKFLIIKHGQSLLDILPCFLVWVSFIFLKGTDGKGKTNLLLLFFIKTHLQQDNNNEEIINFLFFSIVKLMQMIYQ